MGRVLILQHMRDDPPGYLADLLTEYGIAFDIVRADLEPLPDVGEYAAVLALGGDQHLYDAEQYPYFVPEKALIRQTIEREIPFLGICLGSQLLASTLGAQVRKHTLTEIGFFDVPLTEAGKADPLFTGLPGYQTVYHWHDDTFDLPEGAIQLARNTNTEQQAFRYGQHAYGIQYHIELNAEMLELWLHHPDAKQAMIAHAGEEGYQRLLAEQGLCYPTYRAHTRILLQNFLRISEVI